MVREEYHDVHNDSQKSSRLKMPKNDFSVGCGTYEYYEVHGFLYEANKYQNRIIERSIIWTVKPNKGLHFQQKIPESTIYN